MTAGQRFAQSAELPPPSALGQSPDLSVLLVSHGHADFVRACLASLGSGAMGDLVYEFIVIDNLAEPGFADRIGAPQAFLQVIANETRLGFGANMNKAAEIARGRILLILNPDTEYHAGDLAAAVRRLDADPTCGIASARLLNEDGSDQRNFRQFPTAVITALRGFGADHWAWRPDFYRRSLMEGQKLSSETAVDWVYGSFMLIRRSTFEAMGGFDTGYFMYYEDVDLCVRLRRMGLEVKVYPDLQFRHHHQRSSAQRGESRLRHHHLHSFRRYLRRCHTYLFSPATSALPDPVPGWLMQMLPFGLAAVQFLAIWLAGQLAGWSIGTGAAALMPMSLGAVLILVQYMLTEYEAARLGDTPRRVIGVVESLLMASLPWAMLHMLHPATNPPAWALLSFLALGALFAGLMTFLLTLLIPTTGARLGVVAEVAKNGLADGLVLPPMGAATVMRCFDLGQTPPPIADAVSAAIREGQIDALVLSLPRERDAETLRLLHALSMFDIPIWHSHRMPGAVPGRLVMLRWPLRSRTREALKRGLDLVFSLTALLVLAVPMLVVALLIKLEDGGPVFFSQPREGRNQQPFSMLKFRSMSALQADKRADQLTTRKDSRVTRTGAFLRKTSIDELPQLFNVIAGDMSIVGPRPLPLQFHFRGLVFETCIPEWHHRYRVKPGITGLSQLRGLRGTPETPEAATQMMTNRCIYDNLYIDNWTIWLDLRIILMTVLSGAFMAGAY